MENIGHFLKSFFETEEKKLLENYPGLRFEILKKAFFEFAGFGYSSESEFYLAPKWWPQGHQISQFFDEIQKGVPLQYILKESFFYRYSFSVVPGVFIPRPETELLVEMAIQELKKISNEKKIRPKVLDFGTGTGAIVISLLEVPLAGVAYDLNPKAIKTAKRNFFNLKFNFSPSNSIRFLNKDFFESDQEKYHLIISNPPYIKKEADKNSVHQQVKKYEPDLALFIDDEKYDDWFDKFLNIVYLKLESDGCFLMEGHEDHLKKILKQAQLVGFKDIIVEKDLTGRDRLLRARKNG